MPTPSVPSTVRRLPPVQQRRQHMGSKANQIRWAVTVELAKAGLNQQALARRMGIPSTTLSDWLREAHPRPPRFAERVERALGLPAGHLRRAAQPEGRSDSKAKPRVGGL